MTQIKQSELAILDRDNINDFEITGANVSNNYQASRMRSTELLANTVSNQDLADTLTNYATTDELEAVVEVIDTHQAKQDQRLDGIDEELISVDTRVSALEPIPVSNLAELPIGYNLRGMTVDFTETDKTVVAPTGGTPYNLVWESPDYTGDIYEYAGSIGIGVSTTPGAVGDVEITGYNAYGIIVRRFYRPYVGGWVQTLLTFPDDRDILVTSNTLPTTPSTDTEWGFDLAVVKHESEVEERIRNIEQGYVKKESNVTQLIDSDLTLTPGSMLLVERLNGAHEAAIFCGFYGKRVPNFAVGDGITTQYGVVLNRDKEVNISELAGQSITIRNTSTGTNYTLAATSNSIAFGSDIIWNAAQGWIKHILVLPNPNVAIYSVTAQNTSPVPGDGWDFSDIIFNVYEQEEIGSMADPTCINHNAVASDGTVVGDNIIVNYRDLEGASKADVLAYGLKDVIPLANRVTALEEANYRRYGDLSAINGAISLSLQNVTILVRRLDTTTLEIRASSTVDTVLPITHRYSGNNTGETLRETFTSTATGTVIGTVGVGTNVLAEFWTHIGSYGYDIVAGSDDDSLANAWVEVKTSKVIQ